MLISVVIPVYNAGRFLERCLQSVSAQIYRPLEVVLVNDGSTDDSAEICARYQANSPCGIRVKVINQANAGASIARRNGIAAAEGKWLTFIDSDDFVTPQYVSSLYDAACKFNVPIAVCPFVRINVGEATPILNAPSSRCLPEHELFNRFFKYEFWGFGGGIYQKALFNDCVFPVATVNEDYFVKAQIFAKNSRVAFVEPGQYFYEHHEGSLSSLALSERALGEFDNAFATWQFVKLTKPDLSNGALAIACEAACKWLGELNKNGCGGQSIYTAYRKRICHFLSRNLISIILNPKLLWKIKLVIIKNLLITK